MTPERWQQVCAVFVAAVRCPPAGREALLAEVRAADPELRAEVDRLLAHDAVAARDDSLAVPDATSPESRVRRPPVLRLQPAELHIVCPHCSSPIELVGPADSREIVCPSCGSSFHFERESTAPWSPRQGERMVGRFVLIETIGVGAFGTVYKARDPDLDRVVALKVPRAGNLSTPDDRARFVREARNAAQLRHPSIVPVHEVGEHEGTPFLVSDFVAGVTLSDWLTAHKPSLQESARLVASLADALQYAHERGVVHRDVKPSNVLLDDQGQPHLTDFGLAKRDVGEITITIEGQVLGTPAYMSPEQARGEGHQVDGRSDVYSLGVILYKLLAGELPFRGNTRMVLHQVLHDEPRSPRSLNDRIPRDLETICLKAMAKEPARRYESAVKFAADIRRHLAGEPIQARPVGALERSWRWARRHPTAVGLACAVLVAALSLSATCVSLLYGKRLAEERAKSAAINRFLTAFLASKDSLVLNPRSKGTTPSHRPDRAGAAPETGSHPGSASAMNTLDEGLDRVVTLDERLDRTGRLLGLVDGQPAVEAAIRETIGGAYFSLGRYDKAEEQVRAAVQLNTRAAGPEHRDTLRTVNLLVSVLDEIGRQAEAEPLIRRNLGACLRALGPDDEVTLDAAERLGVLLWHLGKLEEAESALRRNVADRRRINPAHLGTLRLTYFLSRLLQERGHFAEAEMLAHQFAHDIVCGFGSDHLDNVVALTNQANLQRAQGKLDRAAVYFRHAAAEARRIRGGGAPSTLLAAEDRARPLEAMESEVIQSLATLLAAEDRARPLRPMGRPEDEAERADQSPSPAELPADVFAP